MGDDCDPIIYFGLLFVRGRGNSRGSIVYLGLFLLEGGRIQGSPQGVAAGEENTPEESKYSPTSGVTRTSMSCNCVMGGAGVEPGRCALGGK